MAPQKRPATAAGAEVKKAKHDGIAQQCSIVAAALGETSSVPTDVAQLLGEMLPESLGIAKDQRHEFQHRVVGMVLEVLLGIETSISKTAEQAQAKVAGADVEKASRRAAASAAEQELAAAKAATAKQEEATAEAASKLEAASQNLASEKKAQDEGDTALVEAEQSQAGLNSVVSDHLVPLKGVAVSKSQVASLVKALSPFELDASLVKSLNLPLSKEPGNRTPFDEVILQQLDSALQKQDAAFAQLLAEGAPLRAQRAAAVAGAQGALDEVRSIWEAAEQALAQAKESEKSAQSRLEAAKKAVGDHNAELLQAAKEVDEAAGRLGAFRKGPLAIFRELCERTTPPPPPQEQHEAAASADAAPQTAVSASPRAAPQPSPAKEEGVEAAAAPAEPAAMDTSAA